MDYEIKKSNRYSVHCSYDGVFDLRLAAVRLNEGTERSGQGSRRNSKGRSASGKISGDSYSTSGRENESECEDPGRNVV